MGRFRRVRQPRQRLAIVAVLAVAACGTSTRPAQAPATTSVPSGACRYLASAAAMLGGHVDVDSGGIQAMCKATGSQPDWEAVLTVVRYTSSTDADRAHASDVRQVVADRREGVEQLPQLPSGVVRWDAPDQADVYWVEDTVTTVWLLLIHPDIRVVTPQAALAVHAQFTGTGGSAPPGSTTPPGTPVSVGTATSVPAALPGCTAAAVRRVRVPSGGAPYLIEGVKLAPSDPSWARFLIAPPVAGTADTITGFAHCVDGAWRFVDGGSYAVGCRTVPRRLWRELDVIAGEC